MELSQKTAEEVLCKLRSAVKYMQQPGNEIDGLLVVRGLLVDHPASEFALHLDRQTVAMLYLVRKLLADVWVNLGTDATFDLETVEAQLRDISRCLASFMQLRLSEPEDSSKQAWIVLTKVIESYHGALALARQALFSP